MSTIEHPADRHLPKPKATPRMPKVQPPAQAQLKFSYDMTPLGLLYLLSIHNGDFDKRVHMGHFSAHVLFADRVRELIHMDMVGYDGQHFIKPRGSAHVKAMLELKP